MNRQGVIFVGSDDECPATEGLLNSHSHSGYSRRETPGTPGTPRSRRGNFQGLVRNDSCSSRTAMSRPDSNGEQVPLQRPRPPEGRHCDQFIQRSPSLNRRSTCQIGQRWSDRFSSVIFNYPNKNGAICDSYKQNKTKHLYTRGQMCCYSIVPCLLFSLLAIAISSLVIYFHLIEVKQRSKEVLLVLKLWISFAGISQRN